MRARLVEPRRVAPIAPGKCAGVHGLIPESFSACNYIVGGRRIAWGCKEHSSVFAQRQ